MRNFFAGLSTRAKALFVAGFIAIVVIAGVAGWWALRPAYASLAQNLTPKDASEIGAALSGWGVPYRFDNGDKTVLVPSDKVYALRMKLAAQGIPKGGAIGFEAFKDSDYGVTEFAQRVNYQLALQGELERTIESMQEVRSARVHLTIHHPGLFEKDQETSKGSVTLHLRPDAHIQARQVVGIQRLVASAVAGLKPGAVTVLNQNGTVLSGSGAAGGSPVQVSEQAGEETKLEKALRTKVSNLLARALHQDDFTVSVAVRLNYNKVKRVKERLLTPSKDGRGVLVHETTDSNGPSVSRDGSQTHEDASATVVRRDVKYAHGQLREEVEEAPGRIERISVGIVIPHHLTAAAVKQLSSVLAAGIGLDPSRGDRIDIAAIAPWKPARNHAATVAHAAGKSAGVVNAAASASKAVQPVHTEHEAHGLMAMWNFGRWSYALLGGGALLLGVLVGLGLHKRRHPRRLTVAEREATLERLVRWVEQPEQAP